MRRSRTESLVVIADDGTRRALFTQTRLPGALATQDVFQVSRDGSQLAYAVDGTLHVRASDGNERTIPGYRNEYALPGYPDSVHMRFSPDGKYLAATTEDHRLVVLEQETGALRELAAFSSAWQFEWSRDRLIAAGWDDRLHRIALVAISLDGQVAQLTSFELFDRFVAAPDGTRVVVFVPARYATRVVAFDIDTPKQTHELGVVHEITNAAISADGTRIAYTTPMAVFEARGNARARSVSERTGVTSLWYSRDDQLGYASVASATVLAGKRERQFDGDGPIAMLRFDAVTGHALVATRAHAWDLATNQHLAIEGEDVLGVDRFAGGTVLWTTPARN